MRRNCLSAFALFSSLLCACAPDGVVDGRPYSLRVPEDAQAQVAPLPLVLLLHGFGGTGAFQDFLFDVSAGQEKNGFLLALPNGTVDEQGRRFWNGSEGCCAPADAAIEVDDVAYLRAVIEDVGTRFQVDPSRIFVVGYSNGGFLSLRMACEASDVVTGVVSVAGAAFDDFSRCPSGASVPVLQLHGTEDEVISFDGGRTRYGPYPGALETTARFARRNGCASSRTLGERLDLEQVEGSETVPEAWVGCPRTGAVELWRMEGVDHRPEFNDRWIDVVYAWLEAHRP